MAVVAVVSVCRWLGRARTSVMVVLAILFLSRAGQSARCGNDPSDYGNLMAEMRIIDTCE